MRQEEFQIVTIIASRKTQFYLQANKKLHDLLTPYAHLIDRKQAELRLCQAISELDDLLFISDKEKATKTINPKLSVSELKLNSKEIIDRVIKYMTRTE
jgi:hypothetical protein